jgi:2-oxoglutarate dehydrogenase E2 component (dihydrolipoamide succinyltransferase)
MEIEIEVPAMGESITSGILAAWLKADGDYVEEGDDLFELETEKTTVAFPAPAAGTIRTHVEEGAEVQIGQRVATLTVGEESPKTRPEPAPPPLEPPREPQPGILSPAVRKVFAEKELDAAAIRGTGKHGRITKEDAVRAAREKESARSPAPPPPPPAPTPAGTKPKGPVWVMPETRPRERVPMSPIRKKTAERLVEARRAAAHLTTFNEIDMAKIMDIRAQRKDEFEKEHGIRIGFMSFFVKASCQALKDFAAVNTVVDGDAVVFNRFYDIGIAISIDAGLVVPIIRDADRLSFAEIEKTIASLAERARGKKLKPDDLTGGTFTITNGGVFGSLLSTPIPAYPQTAILGMHSIQRRPVVVDDQIAVRPMMYVALTYDHRVIDGKDAIGFLKRVKELVEEPDKLLLEM